LKVKTISVTAKASDAQYWGFFDHKDERLLSFNGYAPSFKGLAEGDYIQFQIDNETGKIIGWVPLEDDSFDRLIEEKTDKPQSS
jgi:hypothetical protein